MFPLADDTPRRGRPVVTLALIALNVLAFWVELSMPAERLAAEVAIFGLVPAHVTDWERYVEPSAPGTALFRWLPFVTSTFLHAGWMHLIGNVWTLWIFGDNVEDRLGHGRFLLFYLLCGVAAGVAQVASHPESTAPMIGASGAIAGVLGAYFLLFPRAQVLTVVPVLFYPLLFRMPAVLYLGFWFATQFFSGSLAVASGLESGVAWWAHVGGFVAGVILLGLFRKRAPDRPARRPAGRW